MGAYQFSKDKEHLPDCEGNKCNGYSALYLTFMKDQEDEEDTKWTDKRGGVPGTAKLAYRPVV